MATETPYPRLARTRLERVVPQLDRAVPLKVRACEGRLKFLCLAMLCVALIRRPKIQPLRLHLKLEEFLHSTYRAPVLLVGVETVRSEGRILNLVQSSGDSNSGLLRGCGVDVDKSWLWRSSNSLLLPVHKNPSIGPHSVRVPSKTALASVTCPLGTQINNISNPWSVVVVSKLKRA